jgi:hypothetical protein
MISFVRYNESNTNAMLFSKKHLNLLIVLWLIIGCQHSEMLPQQEFVVSKLATRPLPSNTLDIVNFDEMVVKENDSILVINISDSTHERTIYEVHMPDGKRYHSIQLGRYVIWEDRTTAYYHQSVTDLLTNKFIDLQESGGASIAPNDGAVLYNARFGIKSKDVKGKHKEKILINKLKAFDGQIKTVVDSVIGTLWAPNGNWFLAAKHLGREGKSVLWERALYNRDGVKLSLPSEQSSIAGAAWSQDGSALAIPHAWNSIVTIIELEWEDNTPIVLKSLSNSGFSSPLLWSPYGQFLLYVKYYEDGHTVFGNDIMITDKKLALNYTLIKHDNIREIPIIWTQKDGLITRVGNRLYQYRLEFYVVG